MPRYKLTIAYEGTAFHGWQKQEPPDPAVTPGAAPVPAGSGVRDGRAVLRTVQEIVERAVREVVREPVRLTGASRTDAGVHARGQVAAFTCSGDEGGGDGDAEAASRAHSGWPVSRGLDRLRLAVNARLPEDVLVTGVEAAPETFDPISDASAKGYSYTILCSPDRPLWERRWVFHSWRSLDAEAMDRAARVLEGEHDFAAFAAAGHGRQTTVRRVFECRVRTVEGFAPLGPGEGAASQPAGPRDALIRIDVSGNGFLYNMVRIIAGTLHEVGRGKLDPEAIPAILASRDRVCAGPTLPPEGLCLEWVRYGDRPPA